MKVLIDVAAKFGGGYIAHLKGVLGSGGIPEDMEVFLICSEYTSQMFEDTDPQVQIVVDPEIKSSPVSQYIWRMRKLSKHINYYAPDVHFNPTCQLALKKTKKPSTVTKFENLFPFLKNELIKDPFFSRERVRTYLRYLSQGGSAKRADGVIYLTDYSRQIAEECGIRAKHWKLIPYGLGENFKRPPVKKPLSKSPQILYVSQICAYKHQWNVVEAVDLARKKTGLDITLELTGHFPSPFAEARLNQCLDGLDDKSWVKLPGRIPHNELPSHYHNADLFVFASSVESFGLTLIEAMAAGLPIACSNRRPMTDILAEGGVYFEPEKPESIAEAITKLFEDDELRYRLAAIAYERSHEYSWPKCAAETFGFLREVFESEK